MAGLIAPLRAASGGDAPARSTQRDAQAEATLTRHAVNRLPGGRFVAQAEDALATPMDRLRAAARAFQAAGRELALMAEAAEQLVQINEAITTIDANVAELRYQMDKYPSFQSRGMTFRGQNFDDHARFMQIRGQEQALLRERNTVLGPTRERLQRLNPRASLDRLTKQLADRRHEYRTALDEAKKTAESATATIAALSKDAEVRSALQRLGATLQPSTTLTASLRDIGRAEQDLGQNLTMDAPTRKPTRRGRS